MGPVELGRCACVCRWGRLVVLCSMCMRSNRVQVGWEVGLFSLCLRVQLRRPGGVVVAGVREDNVYVVRESRTPWCLHAKRKGRAGRRVGCAY